ncbi:hypothetical protein GWK47_017427 [Chionoecetes opilio]|uniref:Regulatory protein zeste n=1 Tax=Chionoecetes opilio TaxID=41210 RepID=A0A8J4Y085_CHIOP|nr:hypothetical protein GWK47_017427 [Chionoecetes opilio]
MSSVKVVRRTSPISSMERDHLIRLVKEETDLLTRSTDGRALALKRQAWARIAARLNTCDYGEKRTARQVQKIWERIKARAKQEHQDLFKTGGDAAPPKKSKKSSKMLSILGLETETGCDFDSDAYSTAGGAYRDRSPISIKTDEETLCLPDTEYAEDPFFEAPLQASGTAPEACTEGTTHQPSSRKPVRSDESRASATGVQDGGKKKKQRHVEIQEEILYKQLEDANQRSELTRKQLKEADIRVSIVKEQLLKARMENELLRQRLKGSGIDVGKFEC